MINFIEHDQFEHQTHSTQVQILVQILPLPIIYQQIEFDSTLEPISLKTWLNTRTNITKNKGFLAFAKTKLLYYL